MVRSYHAGFDLYENFNEPVRLVTVFNPQTYNEALQAFHQIETYLHGQITESKGKLERKAIVIGEGDAEKNAQVLQALSASCAEKDGKEALYFLYLVDNDKVVQVRYKT